MSSVITSDMPDTCIEAKLPSFSETLAAHQQKIIRESTPSTLQINLGKLCNLACHHCHVDAGPKRTEIMSWDTIARVLELLEQNQQIKSVDLTGGAPELNPHFRPLVKRLSERNYHIIDRCNLTVLFEKGQEETAQFLADHCVEIVASLPCYSEKNVDNQRGKGSFEKSIAALQKLNELGYGQSDQLPLNLVYNPGGGYLPPAQGALEADYKNRLRDDFGIQFNHLLTITNMPIKRFAHQLENEQQLESYMQTLYDNFNSQAAEKIMCKELISIGWDGYLYDCDFNQMLEIPVSNNKKSLWDIDDFDQFAQQPIATRNHCYACTAGSGSSCSGALT